MRFLPREEKFYADFLKQAHLIQEAVGVLDAAAQKGNSHMVSAATQLREIESRGDEIIHDIFTRLNQTFLTPLDPEDIHRLASHLDNVLDCLEESAYRISAYPLEPIPAPVTRLTAILVSLSKELILAFEALSHDKQILQHCIEINRLENDADVVYRVAVAELFQTETNAIELIKRKEVYEVLEKATDFCEDVADVLQEVVVKNS
ncbi:MAG: DUF47 family protein [Bryobacterales bacterium]|nr:DUF47 family protein [Bryobacterales bacterium]